jgi:hypothetical protein
MPDTLQATIAVSRYSVSCLPDTHPKAAHFTLYVSEHAPDRWVITRLVGKCLSANGTWDNHLVPWLRPAGWEVLHLFDRPTALRLAKQAAAELVVNGQTVADVLAQQAVRAR